MSTQRTLVWFSAGAASAVAAKLVLAEQNEATVVAYIDPGSEHADNQRFVDECERWFDHSIVRLRSDEYTDTWEVFERTRYLVGPQGARCTTELKKRVRYKFEEPDDIQVFGYTIEERHRAERFVEQNPGVTLRTPLIERGLTKDDTLAMIARAGIELPVMYRLGYRNNNCIGCVKGGVGYWNKIRIDFPDVYERMAQVERQLGRTVIRRNGQPVFLDELDPSAGDHKSEPDFECSLMCHLAETEFEGDR